MTVLSYAQLEGLWIASGGARATAPLAAAIAMAESGGRTDVTSPNPDGGVNVGPWQLDTRGKGAGFTVTQLQNPTTNAQVAIRGSSNGRDWSAWETFVTGAYKRFLHGNVPPTGGGPATTTAAGGLGSIVSVFTTAGTAVDWLVQPSHWIRIIAFIVGTGAILLGVTTLSLVGK